MCCWLWAITLSATYGLLAQSLGMPREAPQPAAKVLTPATCSSCPADSTKQVFLSLTHRALNDAVTMQTVAGPQSAVVL